MPASEKPEGGKRRAGEAVREIPMSLWIDLVNYFDQHEECGEGLARRVMNEWRATGDTHAE